MRDAQVFWRKHRPGRPAMLPYWLGTACGVFVVSGLTFWLIPRGDLSFIGPPQISVLPYSGGTVEGDPASLAESVNVNSGATEPELEPVVPIGQEGTDELGVALSPGSQPGDPPINPSEPAANDFNHLEASETRGNVSGQLITGSSSSSAPAASEDDVVFFVRTQVSSYWRGETLDWFDGQTWQGNLSGPEWTRSRHRRGVWHSEERADPGNNIRYNQTFFLRSDQPKAVFAGYRGLRLIANGDPSVNDGLAEGDSYRVVSAYPQYSPDSLRRDYTGARDMLWYQLPQGSERLLEVGRQLSVDAASDFDLAQSIVAYVSRTATLDQTAGASLASLATPEELLYQGKPGSVLDYATATVLLARASGLPSRLALGYLPGAKDPLSGAYMVRQSDARAWAEISFAGNGWVPFDAAPKIEPNLSEEVSSGLGVIFQNRVGDKVGSAISTSPGALIDLTKKILNNPIIPILGPVLLVSGLVLRWRASKGSRAEKPSIGQALKYTRSPGDGRRELLKLYLRAEKMLRKRAGVRRRPWQTVGEYGVEASRDDPALQEAITWFTKAAWQAAYTSGPLPSGLPSEARLHLKDLKAALRAASV